MKGKRCGGVNINMEQAIVEYIKRYNGEWVSAEDIVKNITPGIFRRGITHKYVGTVAKLNSDKIERRGTYKSREQYGYLAEFRYKTEVRE